jgi:hypothetical protein
VTSKIRGQPNSHVGSGCSDIKEKLAARHRAALMLFRYDTTSGEMTHTTLSLIGDDSVLMNMARR